VQFATCVNFGLKLPLGGTVKNLTLSLKAVCRNIVLLHHILYNLCFAAIILFWFSLMLQQLFSSKASTSYSLLSKTFFFSKTLVVPLSYSFNE